MVPRNTINNYVTPDLSHDYYGGTIVNRTYGTHKYLYIYIFLLILFGHIY